MTEFRYDPTARPTGSGKGHFKCAPAALVRFWGRSKLRTDDNKVTGEYVFRDVKNPERVFSIYDFKATRAYYQDAYYDYAWKMPWPEEFWADEREHSLSIGGNGDPTEFIAWLKTQLGHA